MIFIVINSNKARLLERNVFWGERGKGGGGHILYFKKKKTNFNRTLQNC